MLFSLSSKKIQRKQFYQNVLKVIGNSSHQYIDTLIKYIFHDRQEIEYYSFYLAANNSPQYLKQTSNRCKIIPLNLCLFLSQSNNSSLLCARQYTSKTNSEKYLDKYHIRSQRIQSARTKISHLKIFRDLQRKQCKLSWTLRTQTHSSLGY